MIKFNRELFTNWFLFIQLVLTAPTIFYLFVVAGIMPTGAYFLILAKGGILYGFFAILYSCILYYIATRISGKFKSLKTNQYIKAIVFTSAIILGLDFLKIYGAGHNSAEFKNVFEF